MLFLKPTKLTIASVMLRHSCSNHCWATSDTLEILRQLKLFSLVHINLHLVLLLLLPCSFATWLVPHHFHLILNVLHMHLLKIIKIAGDGPRNTQRLVCQVYISECLRLKRWTMTFLPLQQPIVRCHILLAALMTVGMLESTLCFSRHLATSEPTSFERSC